MEDKRILNLVEKFEKSIEETEKLTNALLGLEGVIDKLDKSINEVYELTKVDSISKKSKELIDNLNKLKKVQTEVNKEYKELMNISKSNNDIKEDINELRIYIGKIDENVSLMKDDIEDYKKLFKEENMKFKEELINLLMETHYNTNNKEES